MLWILVRELAILLSVELIKNILVAVETGCTENLKMY